MDLGEKIKQLRIKNGLTQEELGARTELSKGFISQLERNLTSPSIATLMDILEALGTDIKSFFNESVDEKIVYGAQDTFVKVEDGGKYDINWLVTSSQKNAMEPIIVTISPGGRAIEQDAHEGEEFGYVLGGVVTLELGARSYKIRKGDSFYFRSSDAHCLVNNGKMTARVLWISTPPSF